MSPAEVHGSRTDDPDSRKEVDAEEEGDWDYRIV